MPKFHNKNAQKNYYKDQAKQQSQLSKDIQNLKGFIISCDQNRERNALKDAYNFLNEYCDTKYPNLKDNESKQLENQQEQQEKIDLNEQLQKELDQLNKKEEKVFYQFQTGIKKGIVFVKISDLYTNQVDPIELYNEIMSDIHINKKIITKNCHRMIPIQKTCKNDLESIKQSIQELVDKQIDFEKFTESDKQIQWMCVFKARFQEKVKKQEVFDLCYDIMLGHHVNYKEPDYTIYVEVDKTFVFISIIEKYLEFKKCALHTFDHIQQAKQEEKENLQIKKQKLEDVIEKRIKIDHSEEKDVNQEEIQNQESEEDQEIDLI